MRADTIGLDLELIVILIDLSVIFCCLFFTSRYQAVLESFFTKLLADLWDDR